MSVSSSASGRELATGVSDAAVGEFYYRVSLSVMGARPGACGGRSPAGDGRFLRHAALGAARDPRRLDIRASARDPLQRLQVRVAAQRSAARIVAVLDLSASMGFPGGTGKPSVMADFMCSLAMSVHRQGDLLGCVGCGQRLHPAFTLPPGRALGQVLALADRLRRHPFLDRDCRSLAEAAAIVGPKPSLVFLLSDLYLPGELLTGVLDRLSPHQVVPVVIWDAREVSGPKSVGLWRLQDPETGAERTVLLRAGCRRRLQARRRELARSLRAVCASRATRPLFVTNGFAPDQVTRYFCA